MTNMYHREYQGKAGMTVDVSVAAMDPAAVKKWVEVKEHIFLDDTIDGGAVMSAGKLPMYSKGPGSELWNGKKEGNL